MKRRYVSIVLLLIIIMSLLLASCSSVTEDYVLINDGTEYELRRIKYKDGDTLANLNDLFSFEIPSTYKKKNVTSIGDEAFSNLLNLTNVTIPNTVKSIGNKAFAGARLTNIHIPESVIKIGDDIFFRCENLEEITVSENNQYYKSSDGVLYNKSGEILIFYPYAKSTSVVIDDGAKIIKSGAILSSYLTSIVLPDTVIEIEDRAIYGCASLQTITIKSIIPPAIGEKNILFYTMNSERLVEPNESFSIKVPLASLEAYKSAPGWSDYADYIVAI